MGHSNCSLITSILWHPYFYVSSTRYHQSIHNCTLQVLLSQIVPNMKLDEPLQDSHFEITRVYNTCLHKKTILFFHCTLDMSSACSNKLHSQLSLKMYRTSVENVVKYKSITKSLFSFAIDQSSIPNLYIHLPSSTIHVVKHPSLTSIVASVVPSSPDT